MCEVYKCINDIGPSYLQGLFKLKDCGYDTRNLFTLEQPKFNTVKYGRHSISYLGAKLWNSLDNNLKSAGDFKSFKTLISSWEGPSCKCSVCEMCATALL